jgi:hypothetical protein
MALNFGDSAKILLKTTPYVFLQIIVYLAMGIGAGIFLGLFLLIAKVFNTSGGVLFIIGVFALWGVITLIKRYVLYMIKAGHVAVITELIHKGKLPDGINQVEYGKNIVTKMFKEVSVLFLVDQIVSGIIRVFNKVVVTIFDIVPLPGLDALGKLVASVINFSLTFVDESILSYNLSRPNENVWESAKRGLILYAQNWKPILKSAFGIAIFNLIGTVIIVALMLVPFGSLALASESDTWKAIWLVMALTIGYGLKLSIVNPLCLISMILTYNKAIEGQEPNREWEAKLESASSKFRELKEKAVSALSPKQPEAQVR